MKDMIPLMLSGEINPGQLKAARIIENGTSTGGNAFDTAVFSGIRAEYTININNRGTASTADDIVTVTDTVVGRDGTLALPFNSRGMLRGSIDAQGRMTTGIL